MSFQRGMDGYAALGGSLSGSVFVNGAAAAAATTINFDGNGATLLGALAPGDQFTIAGEAGSPTHTVGGSSFILAVANALAPVTFTPAIAAGGVADNAAVTVLANAVAQVDAWTLASTLEVLDTTVMLDAWKSVVGGHGSWSGTLGLKLDYGDPRQKLLIDAISGATPVTVISQITLGTSKSATTLRQWYGAGLLSGFAITQQLGNIVSVSCNFAGSGPVKPAWT